MEGDEHQDLDRDLALPEEFPEAFEGSADGAGRAAACDARLRVGQAP